MNGPAASRPPSPERIDEVLREADLLYSPEEIRLAYDGMAFTITQTLAETPGRYSNPLILAVPIGGLFPAMEIIPRLDFPLEVDYSATGGKTAGGRLHFLARPRTCLKGRTVIVIDDILDEGVTLAAILDFCRDSGARTVFSEARPR
uniref:Hypoxanthine phosphoribosyltransferase n=1 Tax=Candidatus Kentrum sp. FM TaxID=2126340 RepID=A0A450U2I2_9GAMM|nr:MAG: hypoxanthine phosphoribosyltransferase [Candidatus Kentron sp. FM]VFJ77239.1 MAG: hypoxanthine phosphoribosyltransferase [Candidatus Kentron sp. FM]VFK16621.1 MAG: hypoxanthine phosphoribosyltransferase [Candidatus Kentron sp. FM]